MANSLKTNPIYIDTLTTAVDMADYYPGEMILDSIEWSQPTVISHYGVVLCGGSSGVTIFHEQCTVQNQSVIKYFHGAPVSPLCFPTAGTSMNASGRYIVTIKR
jgi:hypothetical protein